MLVPGSSTIAPIPFSAMSRRAFSIRALRSSSEIGTALPGNGFSAAMDGGALLGPLPRCAPAGTAYDAAAAMAEVLTNVRRDMRVSELTVDNPQTRDKILNLLISCSESPDLLLSPLPELRRLHQHPRIRVQHDRRGLGVGWNRELPGGL